jgi:hypothetical protein
MKSFGGFEPQSLESPTDPLEFGPVRRANHLPWRPNRASAGNPSAMADEIPMISCPLAAITLNTLLFMHI